MFHPFCDSHFKSWPTVKALYTHIEDHRHENVIIKNTHHPHQTDLAPLCPLELYMMNQAWPETTTNESYQLFQLVKLRFLSQIGFLNSASHDEIDNLVQKMEKQWVVYDKKYHRKHQHKQLERTFSASSMGRISTQEEE